MDPHKHSLLIPAKSVKMHRNTGGNDAILSKAFSDILSIIGKRGEDINATFMNGPGNPKDWVGIYPEGAVPGPTPSTRWNYVDNTQNGNTGFKDGTVTIPGGLTLAGNWFADFFLDDGYTVLAHTVFTVVDPGTPLVRPDKRRYTLGETITVVFSNNSPASP